MNALLVLAVTIGIVSADVGLGYQYKVPHTSYGAPSYPIGGSLSATYNTGFGSISGPNAYKTNSQSGYQGVASGPQNSHYQGVLGIHSGQSSSAGYQTGSSGVGNQYYQTSPGNSNAALGTLVQPGNQYAGNIGQSGFKNYNQYQTSSNYQQKYNYQYQQQPTQVYKHFYVHSAPEEPEHNRPRTPIVLPPPQKHYKIIFIKTPTHAPSAPQYVPVQPQSEEKTIVYVLVNKPEDYQDVVVPKVVAKPPSKPEVYFVKYNSKEGSQAVINNIVNDYSDKDHSESIASADAASSIYPGQQTLDSGATSISEFTRQSSQGYPEQPSVGSEQVVSSQSESDLVASLGTPFGLPSASSHTENHSASNYDSSLYSGSSESSGLVSHESIGASSPAFDNSHTKSSSTIETISISSSTPNYQAVNTISTSQGVPHETYGVPKFKSV